MMTRYVHFLMVIQQRFHKQFNLQYEKQSDNSEQTLYFVLVY